MKMKIAGAGLLGLALAVFLGPLVVMIGWNMFAAGVLGAPAIGYWPAFWATNALQVLFSSGRMSNGSD